jgi:hypothetical protein
MRRRILFVVAAVAAVALAGLYLDLARSGTGAPVTTARAAKPPTPRASVFVAPDGLDSRSCRSRAKACASFDRAYRAARPGQVVEVADGRYGPQEIRVDPRKRSRRHVVFRPAEGGRVVLDGLTLGTGDRPDGPRHVTIQRMSTSYVSETEQRPVGAMPGTRDVVLRNLDAGNFNLWGVQRVKVLGGDYGPCHSAPGSECGNARIDAGPPGNPTRDVLVDGATFHDFRFAPSCYQDGVDCHFECVYLNGSRNVTIRRSTFRDCALFDLFVTLSGRDAARVGHRNLKIENNWFDTPWDESGLHTASRRRASALAISWCGNSPHGYDGVLIRHNSFQRNTGLQYDPDTSCRMRGVRVVGNLAAFAGCDGRWAYAFNVWSSTVQRGRCSRTDRTARAGFPYVRAGSGAGLDFHLTGARTAADALVPARATGACPSRDVDGDRRTARGRCDAGSDERP